MSEPQDPNELLKEIRDTQREHLAEYRRVTTKLIDGQQQAVARARKAARWLVGLVVVALALLFLVSPTGPMRCILNAARRGQTSSTLEGYPIRGRSEGKPYRFTAAQLGEIREAEERFKGVDSITALLAAFGEPDAVVDTEYGPEGFGSRRYLYPHRWQTIDAEVHQYFGGNFALRVMPKPTATQPAEP
jgi:hypothetical protein